jgi:uncharacterized membrane protein YcaP (DUF421 family)
LLTDALKYERVSHNEALAAIRGKGYSDIHDLDALILETDGSFSVIASVQGSASALKPVRGFAEGQQ